MKRDLKLNMSHLDAISRKVQSYIDAMEAVGLAARKFEQTIKDQDSDAYNKLSEQWETNAWEQRHLVEPISDGMGGTIYNIPYKNAGYESGYINTGAQMDYITIVTLDESTDLITAFLSFGDYHK